MAERLPTPSRDEYPHFQQIPTRWMDNDIYGHVNNVHYYSFFDTVVNRYLIGPGEMDFMRDDVFGVVVNSSCHYLKSFAYPDVVDGGLRVARLGNTSVTYEIGLFHLGDNEVAAHGTFVHVFVRRDTRRPTPIPEKIKTALAELGIA